MGAAAWAAHAATVRIPRRSAGVEEVAEAGVPFDPRVHEAIMQVGWQCCWVGVVVVRALGRSAARRQATRMQEGRAGRWAHTRAMCRAQEYDSAVPDNTVLLVLQKGYKAGDKLLRPALVKVSTS